MDTLYILSPLIYYQLELAWGQRLYLFSSSSFFFLVSLSIPHRFLPIKGDFRIFVQWINNFHIYWAESHSFISRTTMCHYLLALENKWLKTWFHKTKVWSSSPTCPRGQWVGRNVKGRQKVKQFLLFKGMQCNMLSWSSRDLNIRGIAGSLSLHMQHSLGMLIWCVIVLCLELTVPSVPCFIEQWDFACSLQMSTHAYIHTHTHTCTAQSLAQSQQKPLNWLSTSSFDLSRKFRWVRYWNRELFLFHRELGGPSG